MPLDRLLCTGGGGQWGMQCLANQCRKAVAGSLLSSGVEARLPKAPPDNDEQVGHAAVVRIHQPAPVPPLGQPHCPPACPLLVQHVRRLDDPSRRLLRPQAGGPGGGRQRKGGGGLKGTEGHQRNPNHSNTQRKPQGGVSTEANELRPKAHGMATHTHQSPEKKHLPGRVTTTDCSKNPLTHTLPGCQPIQNPPKIHQKSSKIFLTRP